MPNESPTEIWKTIEEFPDYAVSSLGRVKRTMRDSLNRNPRTLKLTPDKDGYRTVCLYRNRAGITKRVARLVAVAFLEPDLLRRQVNHKNGNRSDDRVENLEWTTCSENHVHSFRHLGR